MTPPIGGSERAVAELPQVVLDRAQGVLASGPNSPSEWSWSFAWLPDGRSVILDGLQSLSLDTGEGRDVTDGSGRSVAGWYPAIAPNGRRLAFCQTVRQRHFRSFRDRPGRRWDAERRTAACVAHRWRHLGPDVDCRRPTRCPFKRQTVRQQRPRQGALESRGRPGSKAGTDPAGRGRHVARNLADRRPGSRSCAMRGTPTSGGRPCRRPEDHHQFLPGLSLRRETTGTRNTHQTAGDSPLHRTGPVTAASG